MPRGAGWLDVRGDAAGAAAVPDNAGSALGSAALSGSNCGPNELPGSSDVVTEGVGKVSLRHLTTATIACRASVAPLVATISGSVKTLQGSWRLTVLK